MQDTSSGVRRFALIALGVLLCEEIVIAGLFALRDGIPFLQRVPVIAIAGFLFSWIVPLAIVYGIENRDVRSLGLFVRRRLRGRYTLYAFAGLVLPAFVCGADRALLLEFIEQVAYIGVAEEVFSRGYLMGRLCCWLGERKGLLLNALIFGLAHVVSRLAQHGLQYPAQLAILFVQTFAGGLLLGYIYLRTKNVVPGAILHTSTNAYLPRLLGMLGG